MRKTAKFVVLFALVLGGMALGKGGAALYQAHCAACHGPGGEGVPGVFPPLKGNPHVQDPAYVAKVIREGKSGPLTVGGTTYNGQMPPFAQLSEEEVEALARYVAGGMKGQEGAAPAKSAAPAGDPETGRALFIGQRRFKNGGPPCVACHNAKGIGVLGGGALGPDLSDAGKKFGPSLPQLLEKPGFRVMRSVYADKPLTPKEAADVAAFLEKPGKEAKPARAGATFFGLGALGTALLFLLMLPAWPRQKVTYRDLLKRRQK